MPKLLLKTKNELIDQYIKDECVEGLCLALFPNHEVAKNLTKHQVKIVGAIAFAKTKRQCINAMTRYGKSACVAIGVAIYLYLNKNKKVAIIAPGKDQTSIVRNYIAECIIGSPEIANLIQLDRTIDVSRLNKEASKDRWTFKNGCELKTLSAEGEANRLMGFGADLIVIDEAALISREAYAKIIRMLGDDPENAMLIELANPWSRDNKYYDHWVSTRFEKIHIGYKEAIEEGRVTQSFIDEVQDELTPLEFVVLYESNFPDESEDSIFKLKTITDSIERDFDVDLKSKTLKKVIACDVADKGKDKTVIIWGYEDEDHFKIEGIYHENKSENMQIVGKIMDIANDFGCNRINIDTIGVGVGVVSRVRELCSGTPIRVIPCHFGESAGSRGKVTKPNKGDKIRDRQSDSNVKRYQNKKAEQYFRLNDLFTEGQMDIPKHDELVKQLMNEKWEFTSTGKIKILDPEEYSPDFADALVYFTWKSMSNVAFSFNTGGEV